MKTQSTNHWTRAGFSLLASLALTAPALAASITWNGPATTNAANNWTDGANWTGGTPPTSADDAKFFDGGAIPGVSNINNTVDVTTNIASLQFGNTNSSHTMLIASGATLNITGAGGLTSATPADPNVVKLITNTITGSGGTLNLNNSAANLIVVQGTASANGSKGQLDMSGLDTFTMNGKGIGLGSTLFTSPGAQRLAGVLYLAKTNTIRLSQSTSLATYLSNGGQLPGISISHNAGNNSGNNCILFLGQTNAIFMDSITIGGIKAATTSSGRMQFNPSFSNPVAFFRGTNATGSGRVKWWSIGDMGAGASTGSTGTGTNDFTGGTVDAMIDTLSLGRDPVASHTASGNNAGVLTFTAGTIDVNTVFCGNQGLGTASASTTPEVGLINVTGPSALFRVNGTLTLANTITLSGSAVNSFGRLNITNGTANVSNILVGANSLSANTAINVANATLIVSNAVATSAKPVTNFFIGNSRLGLTLTADASAKAFVGTMTTAGLTNIIQLAATPPVFFASYPTQFTLVKYSALNNFNVGLSNVPAWLPSASIVSNGVNNSIDLVLPGDPRPVITSGPSGYSGSPGDNVTFSVSISPYSVTPLSYQWFRNGTPLTDGATGNGSTLSGANTASLTITSAQPADSASAAGYTLGMTNAYGNAASAPATLTISASDIPPVIAGPTNQTVIQGNNATFVAGVTGYPLPTQQWRENGTDIPNATNTTLVLPNVQYAQNGYVYSIVASNVTNSVPVSVTNSMTLTVIVTPSISAQPTNLAVTVGSSATFSVTASGVPAVAYQWQKNGSPIALATASSYTIPSTVAADIAAYSVVITNDAGSVTSSNANLVVNSTMAATALSPTNGATGVCYDTPLYITFSQTPVLRNAGTIKIFNATNTSTPVETIDLSLNNGSGVQSRNPFPGDAQSFNYYPVIIAGSTAAVYPHGANLLTSNQTYYVIVDNGTFADTSGNYFIGITDTNAWRFTTKPTGPANPTNIIVAADGSGDFLTVQGAVDSVPSGSTTSRLINVRDGNYVEIVDIAGKHNLLVRGQSRANTIVGYANNALIAPAGSTHSRMAFKINANDISLDNITITNRTPVGGSQAEAIMVETNARRFIFNNSTLASFQDTLLVNQNSSECYFYNSLVQGQFDYLWGGGRVFLTNCEIKTLVGNGGALNTGNITASRTDLAGTNGFSFMRCQLTRIIGTITNTTMAGANGTAGGNAAFISCNVDYNYTNPAAAVIASQILWEFGNSNLDNTLPRTFGLTVLTEGDGRLTAARTATIWLNGWVPQLLPNILSQPTNQSVAGGATASFTVVATGIPDPTYQWQHYGTNVPGATSPTLTINTANANDAGDYAVVVSNSAGSVNSSTVALTVGNNAPTLVPVGDSTVNVGGTVNFTANATDSDVPAQSLSFTLLSAPVGATLGSSSGVFNFRPDVTQSGTSNFITMKVADNGSPSLSATQSFAVVVNVLNQSSFGPGAYSGGTFSSSVTGDLGPDYAVRASTNLVDWETIYTTNSPAMPFDWSDPNAGSYDQRYYQIKAGPPLP